MIPEEILHRCFRCGYCKLPSNYIDVNCPSYLAFRFETYSPGGRMWLLRAWREGKISTSRRLGEIMFSCAACGSCTEHCVLPKLKDYLQAVFGAGREALLEAGRVPGTVRDYLTAIQLHGNPYKMPAKRRTAWSETMAVEAFSDQDYLLFTDDVSAYDPRGSDIARGVAAVLQAAGVSFGIQTPPAYSDGNDAAAMGESGLFEELAYKNIDAFDKMSVKRILTLSPHAYNALKNDYPALGGRYLVHHYTQVMAFAMDRLNFSTEVPHARVAFHDPCYLGRHGGDYESPRMMLRALPGVELVEMGRHRKNALCCGGGGGNFFTDILSGGGETPSRVRVREALSTGAQVLAVACPQCAIMLEAAVKAEGLESRLAVKEVSEIVRGRMAGA
jgi:Fe-S oxidoreductase